MTHVGSENCGIHVRNNQFILNAKFSSYAFRVAPDGDLEHLHWGMPLSPDDNLDYLINGDAVAFDAGVKNARLREYGDAGTGDYRLPSFRLRYLDDGSSISPLVFSGYDLYENGLKRAFDDSVPHFRVHENAHSLVVHLKDELKQFEVDLIYTIFCDHDSLTRHVTFRNKGQHRVVLEEVNSAIVDFPNAPHDRPYHLTHLSGSHARERMVVTKQLDLGLTGIESRRGASSHQHNPFLIVSEGTASETDGQHYAFGLVYAGSFRAMTEVNQKGFLRVSMGIQPDGFRWILEPGKHFQTPEVVLSYSANGMGELSRRLHRLIRQSILPGAMQSQWTWDSPRPILINSWEAMYFGVSEGRVMHELVHPAKPMGLDMVVLDDGWFINRYDDARALGDWEVDRQKFPRGLEGLADSVNSTGLMFGIWMEPEMISKESELYRQHPDWCVHAKGRQRTESRNQLVLDLSRDVVQDFIVASVSKVLRESRATYLKWDFNRHLTEMGNEVLDVEHQGEFLHRWVMGLYRVWYRLTTAFPHVLFESCSGGGGRYDLALMYFTPQVWTSDNTDAVARVAIQYGSSFLFPFNAMGSHVSAVPNHQLHRSTPLVTRHIVAMSGMLGYELDLQKQSPQARETISKFIQWFKRDVEPVVLAGDVYRLTSPFQRTNLQAPQVTAWMTVLSSTTRAVVYTVLTSYVESIIKPARIRLQGLDPKRQYDVDGVFRVDQEGVKREYLGRFSGAVLMAAGLMVQFWVDADAAMFILNSH